jgi:glutaconate CoA-transferase subunit B
MIGGTYASPQVRLPGAGGAPEIATASKEVWIILKQSKRTFVEKLHFITSAGFRQGQSSAPKSADTAADCGPTRGRGPTIVITDLGILIPDPTTGEFTLSGIHPGASLEQVRAATGWDLKVFPHLETTPPPTAVELAALRDLHARTDAAHGSSIAER